MRIQITQISILKKNISPYPPECENTVSKTIRFGHFSNQFRKSSSRLFKKLPGEHQDQV